MNATDRFLEALRTRLPDAYRSDGIGRWRAFCPACKSFLYERRSLVVSEHGRGVRLRCEHGCAEEAILEALAAEETPPPLLDAHPGLVGALIDEVHRLRRLLADEIEENCRLGRLVEAAA